MSNSGTRICGCCGRELRIGEPSTFMSDTSSVLRCLDCVPAVKPAAPSAEDELREEAIELIRRIRIGMAPELDSLDPPGLRDQIDAFLARTAHYDKS